jgi:hypothetical protein
MTNTTNHENNEPENQHPEFGSPEVLNKLWHFFIAQGDLFNQAYKCTHEHLSGELWGVILPLGYSALDTCGSISTLTQQGKMRDCFILSRTVFETLVNICFILAEGEPAAVRACQHAMQKAHRDLARKSTINGKAIDLKFTGSVILKAETQAALDAFTSKKGREITSWTPETTLGQIVVIDSKFGTPVGEILHFALLAIYRHSSEIAHGTYFGALFSLGMTSPDGPPETPKKLEKRQRENMCMILQMLGMSLSATIEALAASLPLQDILQSSRGLIKQLRDEPWVQAGSTTNATHP